MSNLTYENEFYNKYQKERFLNAVNVSADTRKTYSRIFTRSAGLENSIGKDLYEFNLPQIEQLLTLLDPLSISSSISNGSIVQSYIRWAIEEGLREHSINPMDAFSGREYYQRFIDKSKKRIFTKEEIDDVVDRLVNAQDALCLQMLFEGIDLYEGLNLTLQEVDFEKGTLRLRDKGNSERTFYGLSQKSLKLISQANNERTYYKNNGNVPESTKSKETYLIESPYVLKKSNLRPSKNAEKGDYHLINRRIRTIREEFDFPYMTAISIRNSGMLWELKKFYDEENEIRVDHYQKICERFHIPLNKDKTDYNYQQFRSDFLNLETILEAYGDS